MSVTVEGLFHKFARVKTVGEIQTVVANELMAHFGKRPGVWTFFPFSNDDDNGTYAGSTANLKQFARAEVEVGGISRAGVWK